MCRRICEIVKNKATLTLVVMGIILMIAAVGLLVYFFMTIDVDSLPLGWMTVLSSCIIIYIVGFFIGLTLVVYVCAKVKIDYEPMETSNNISETLRNAFSPEYCQNEQRYLNIPNSTNEDSGCSISMDVFNAENTPETPDNRSNLNFESRTLQELHSYANVISQIRRPEIEPNVYSVQV